MASGLRIRRAVAVAVASASALILFAALAPSSAYAAPQWQPPQLVNVLGGGPYVALAETGDALAIWFEGPYGNRIARYAWRTPRGGWGPARTLATAIRDQPAIGMSSFGTATVAFTTGGSELSIATGRPGQALEVTDTLKGSKPAIGGFGNIALAVDDEGGATVAWSAIPALYVATRRPGARFDEPQRLVANGFAFQVALAVNPAGAAILGWGQGSQRMLASYRLPGETRFGAVEKVPFSAPGGGRPNVAVRADGTAVVARSRWGASLQYTNGLAVVERSPVGGFGKEQVLEGVGELQALVPEPGEGASFIANHLPPSPTPGVMTLTTRAADGTIGAPTTLSTGACFAHAASNVLGQVFVTFDAPCQEVSFGAKPMTVEARRRPAPGALLDAPVVLTSNGSTSQLAANGAGEAIAIYYEGSGTTIGSEAFYAITSRAFEDPAAGAAIVKPVIGGGSQPAVTLPQAGGAVGLPVTCPADCTLVPDGILATNGRGVAHSAAAGKRRLARKRRTMVRVRFTKAQMRSARRALRSGKRASVSYTVTVRRRGSATPLSFSRRIRLKLR